MLGTISSGAATVAAVVAGNGVQYGDDGAGARTRCRPQCWR